MIVTTPANGKTGHLLRGPDGHYSFRVYRDHVKYKFTDYELTHFDLMVTIEDDDSAFYRYEDGTKCLDHAPETLGRKSMNTEKFMTATEALALTSHARERGDEQSREQLRELLETIHRHALMGLSNMTYYDKLSSFASLKLESLGYNVYVYDTQRDGYSVKISWKQ